MWKFGIPSGESKDFDLTKKNLYDSIKMILQILITNEGVLRESRAPFCFV